MASTSSEAPLARLCSRQGCKREALSTLTYVYADSTAVIGPLSVHNEPHAYDLCEIHAARMTAPRGWEVLRVEVPVPGESLTAASHASITELTPGLSRTPADQSAQPERERPVDRLQSVDRVRSDGPRTTSTPTDRESSTGARAANQTSPENTPRLAAVPDASPSSASAAEPSELEPSELELSDLEQGAEPSPQPPDGAEDSDRQGFPEDTEQFYDDEDSLVNEIFARDTPDSAANSDATADQPRGMRIPHLRRRPRRHT
ncbi:DUF3499 family protein [Kocuria sp.]|uniref:DUF3499 family protein n=1 Tax=Kocuria sp. TaxID=1871328 RepID=UPI0034CE9FB4